MKEVKYYTLCTGASQRSIPLFATYMVYPVDIIATILCYQDGLELRYVALHFIIIFGAEWLMRNLYCANVLGMSVLKRIN